MRSVLAREVGEAQVQSALEANKSGWRGRVELIDNLKFVSQISFLNIFSAVMIAVALSRYCKIWSTKKKLQELNSLPLYLTVTVIRKRSLTETRKASDAMVRI